MAAKKKAPGPVVNSEQAARAMQALRAIVKKKTGEDAISEDISAMACISSGSSCINDLIGGSLAADGSGPKCPGYPRKHITEIYGGESSGKTTAALQAVAECQKAGGRAMYLDFEHALDHAYAKKIGVSFDPDKLALFSPVCMEDGFKMISFGIQLGVDLIVIDSVAAMIPKSEYSRDLGEGAKIGIVANIMSQQIPKVKAWLSKPKTSEEGSQGYTNPLGTALVLINQTRSSISTGGWGGGHGGSEENTPGGKALKFYYHVRLKFSRVKSEIIKRKDPISGKDRNFPYGSHTSVKLVKSKIDGKQGYTTDIFIRYNQGIDDYYSMIEAAANYKLVTKAGASSYTYDGTTYRGREKFRSYLVANPKVFEELRSKVLSAVRAGEKVIQDDELSDEDELLQGLDDALGDTLHDPEAEEVEIETAEE